MEIQPCDVKVVGVMHRLSNDERVDFFVEVKRWSGDIRNMEPDKCDDLRWFAWDDLPNNIIPYVHTALANYRQGNWFDSVGFDREE